MEGSTLLIMEQELSQFYFCCQISSCLQSFGTEGVAISRQKPVSSFFGFGRSTGRCAWSNVLGFPLEMASGMSEKST